MTAIKLRPVSSARHARNLSAYLDDGRALARGSQNLVDPGRWSAEMEETRRAYGHDRPSRAGSSNIVEYHVVLAFNPDECDVNGGPVTPEVAMDYAASLISGRWPDQEAAWCLHREHCEADGTDRYAVHVAVNRTDLATGRRLDERSGWAGKRDRAEAIRAMDERYGLAQMEAGKRNSAVHARQPTRAERGLQDRGERSQKAYIREAVKASAREARGATPAERQASFGRALAAKGVDVRESARGDDVVYTRRRTGFRVTGTRLGRGYSAAGVAAKLGVGLCVRSAEAGLGE